MRVRRAQCPGVIQRGERSSPAPEDSETTLRGPLVVEDARGVVCIAARFEGDTAALARVVEALPCRMVHRAGALVVATRVWGRVPAGDGRWAQTQRLEPGALDAMRDYARAIGDLFRRIAPRAWAVQHTRVGRHALAPGAPWSTGSINRATATAYHRDSLNLPRAWSGMLVLRGPGVEGGELVLPELGVALDLCDGDVLFFDGGDLWHGNRPLTVPPGSWRYSLPCYGMAGIA